jgi:CheY-like chemotaxis protein
MSSRERHLLIVDDLASVREGLALQLAAFYDDLLIETMGFEGVEACEDFARFDYVILDLCRRTRQPSAPLTDATSNEYPCWDALWHIREHSVGRGPWTIVVTGETMAYGDPLVLRMLQDLKADFFVERTSLETQLGEVFASSEGDGRPILEEPDLAETPLAVDDALGVTRSSRAANLYQHLSTSRVFEYAGKGGGSGRAERAAAQAVGNIQPRGATGKPTPRQGVRSHQLEEFFRRVTRIAGRR